MPNVQRWLTANVTETLPPVHVDPHHPGLSAEQERPWLLDPTYPRRFAIVLSRMAGAIWGGIRPVISGEALESLELLLQARDPETVAQVWDYFARTRMKPVSVSFYWFGRKYSQYEAAAVALKDEPLIRTKILAAPEGEDHGTR